MSRLGLVASGVYLIVAINILASEAKSSSGGNWITLKNLVPALLTFPIYAPLEYLGHAPDVQNKAVMALLLAGCAVLIYFTVALVAKGIVWLFAR